MPESAPFQTNPCFLTFSGTSVLGADATSVAAIDVQIAAASSYVADLATLTDGPAGLAGPGSVASWEIPDGSGQYLREIRQFSDNSVYTNRWGAGAWGGWQGGGAPASTPAPQHIETFDATASWTAVPVDTYLITIAAATHGIAAPTEIQVQQGPAGGPYTDALNLLESGSPGILASGDVTISVASSPFDGRFEGRVIIK